jgi:HAD superfamily hydrolase (TIGR01549 family)
MAVKALLFDVDCTLWDSPRWYSRALRDLAGADPSDVSKRFREGESIVRILASCGITKLKFVRGCLNISSAIALYPNVRETLRNLFTKNTPLGILTALPGKIVLPLLEGLEINGYFGAVVHAGNCITRKPNPSGIFMTLRTLKVKPSKDVYYVGDRPVDAETARNAGISFVWVEYACDTERPEGTSRAIKNFRELIQL